MRKTTFSIKAIFLPFLPIFIYILGFLKCYDKINKFERTFVMITNGVLIILAKMYLDFQAKI